MRKSTKKQFVLRIFVYCLGMLLLAFGVVLSVRSDLGVSPISSFPYVVSLIADAPLGITMTVCYCFFILLQALILGREFPPINLLEILFSTIFGYFVDFAELVLGDFTLSFYIGRLAMLAASLVLIALGLVVYMDAQLVPMPMEGLIDCVARKVNKPFSTLKTITDCVVVLTGIVLGLLFLGGVQGIREGTLITAALTGKLVALMRKRVTPIINRICFGE